MWTRETRAEYDRDALRYPSDLTNAEWRILAPLLPRIPTKSAIDSDRSQPPVPIEASRAFRWNASRGGEAV